MVKTKKTVWENQQSELLKIATEQVLGTTQPA
jgi:hypothetical protein